MRGMISLSRHLEMTSKNENTKKSPKHFSIFLMLFIISSKFARVCRVFRKVSSFNSSCLFSKFKRFFLDEIEHKCIFVHREMVLKVNKSRKHFLEFSILSKNKRNYENIFSRASFVSWKN